MALLATTLTYAGLLAGAGVAYAAAGVLISSPTPGATVTSIPFDVDFSLAESGSDASCRVDGGSWTPCYEPSFDVDRLANGAHTVQIFNRDSSGSTASASVNFTLADTTAPAATVDAPANGSTLTDSGAAPAIATTITGDHLLALCAYDDNPAVDCSLMASYDPTPLSNGSHTARAVVYDGAGNASTAASTFTMADSAAPALAVTSPGDGATLTDQPEFDLTIDDPSARVYVSSAAGRIHQVDTASGTSLSVRPPALSNGAHAVTFFAIDAAGNESTVTRNITLADTTTPVLSNLQPADSSTVDGDHIQAGFDSDDNVVTGSCSIDGHAQFDCYPGATFGIGSLTAGAHQLAVTVTDQSGNSASSTSDFSVSLASEGSLTIDSPAHGAVYTAEPRLYLSGVGSIDYVRCRLGGNGPWFDCAYGGRLAGLVNGTNSLEVRALSLTGDLLTANSDFTVNDTTAPELRIDFPVTGENIARLGTFAPQFDIRETYDDGYDSEALSVRCKLDSAIGTPCDEGALLYGYFAIGSHALKVMATDWAGNTATESVTFGIGDSTAPSIKILSPQNGAVISRGRPALTFWSDDPSADFKCRVDSGAEESCFDGTTWLPYWESGEAIAFGPHTLHVIGTDRAGNTTAVNVGVTVTDAVAPVLTIYSPAAASTLTDHVAAEWTANEPVVRVRCRVDGGAWTADPDQCRLSGPYGEMSGRYTPATIANGSRTLTIEGFDAAGNVGSASVAVTVSDVTPPRVRILGFTWAGEQNVFDDAPTGVEYTSDDEIATFQCKLNSGVFTSCAGPGFGGWAFAPPAPGSHTVTVRATDPSGLTSDATATFTVADTVPPQIAVRIGSTPLFNGAIVPMVFSAQIDLDGATSASCAIDGGNVMDCSSGTLAVNLGGGGPHTLAITALDAAANQSIKTLKLTVDPATVPPSPTPSPTPTPVPTPPVNPPASPSPPKPPSVTIAAIKPKLGGSIITVLLNLRISPSASVFSCSGSASVNATVRGKSIKRANSTLKPASAGCAMSAKLKLKRKLAAGKRVTFTVGFTGNGTVGAFSVSRSIKIKKR